jgi:hypothetical protein
MDLKFTYVYAYGHVYALTPKGASVRSDSLIWNKKSNQVTTQSYVRVVSEDGDVLQGQGFVSDAHMDNWRILSNVTGIFQDAARRLKDEDKKQAKEIETRDSAQAATPASTPASSASAAPTKNPQQASPQNSQQNTQQNPPQKPQAKAEPAKPEKDAGVPKAAKSVPDSASAKARPNLPKRPAKNSERPKAKVMVD